MALAALTATTEWLTGTSAAAERAMEVVGWRVAPPSLHPHSARAAAALTAAVGVSGVTTGQATAGLSMLHAAVAADPRGTVARLERASRR